MKIDPNLNVMLAKLLSAEYLNAFLDGNLHMNSAAYFKELDAADVLRADCDEGLDRVHPVVEIAIQDKDGAWIPINGVINPVKYWSDRSSDFNMLCLYMFSDQLNDVFDDRNLAFGDTFVLITNPHEFVRRVRSAASSLSRPCAHAPVEYICTETYDGPMGPFRKFARYDYQKEFRVVLKGGGGALTTLTIGDIRDICVYGPLAEFSELILRLKPATAPNLPLPNPPAT